MWLSAFGSSECGFNDSLLAEAFTKTLVDRGLLFLARLADYHASKMNDHRDTHMSLQRIFILFSALLLVAGCASNFTHGESDVCEIHHSQMGKTRVPIHYGLIRPGERARARYAASTNAFPHARDWLAGGCVVSSSSPRRAVIYTCDA